MRHIGAMLAALLWAGLATNGAGLVLKSEPLQNAEMHEAVHRTQAKHFPDAGRAGVAEVVDSSTHGAVSQADKLLGSAKAAKIAESIKAAKTLLESTKAARTESEKARDAKLSSCLADKRIVFIGPSTSKADYIALAYFAEYGIWPTQDVVAFGQGQYGPNPISEGVVASSVLPLPPIVTMPTWKAGCQSPVPGGCETYMRYSNNIFNGHEACDCYEFGTWSAPADLYNSTENRVYLNGKTMISYFQYFGDVVPPRGTFDITPLLQVPPQPIQQTCPVGQFPGTWSWAKTLPDFLRTVVRQSKPTHVVVSSSFWPITPLNKAFWDDVAAAGAESVMDTKGTVIWKSTPQRIHESMQHRYVSPRLDMTPFGANGWHLFPAGQIVETLQGAGPNDAFFYDFAHIRPIPQCHVMQALLAAHVCPGVPL